MRVLLPLLPLALLLAGCHQAIGSGAARNQASASGAVGDHEEYAGEGGGGATGEG